MVKSIFTILLVGIVSSPIMLSTAFVNLAKIDSFTTSTRTRSNMLHDTFSSVAYKDSQTDMSRRLPVIAGNWKLNPSTASEARNMLKLLASNFLNQDSISLNNVEVIVFPPFPFLEAAIQELQGTGIKIGAQNVGTKTKGAFTGEVAPSMLASLGCAYVMLGHSERRVLFEEGDKVINEKMKICLEEGKTGGMGVILCVGETEEEYENNLLKSVVDLQVKKGLTGIPVEDLDRVIIAYEPVWAIGTGKVATPGQAQNAHVVIRKTLVEMYGHDAAQSVRIQYGGSVTPDSVESLMAQPDVDGALVSLRTCMCSIAINCVHSLILLFRLEGHL
jgi:triosephosphate isomerase